MTFLTTPYSSFLICVSLESAQSYKIVGLVVFIGFCKNNNDDQQLEVEWW